MTSGQLNMFTEITHPAPFLSQIFVCLFGLLSQAQIIIDISLVQVVCPFSCKTIPVKVGSPIRRIPHHLLLLTLDFDNARIFITYS